MKKKVLIAGMFLALVATLFFFREEAVAPVQTPDNVLRETTSRDGLVFTHPKDFGLAVSDVQVLVRSYIPPCDEEFDYCFYFYDEAAYAGTNFESAGVRIQKRANLRAREACLDTPPEGYAGIRPNIRTEQEYATSVFSPLGNAAAGHYATGALYRLAYDLGCYEFETRIGESQFANYPSGTIQEFTDADRQAVGRLLMDFIESIQFASTGEKVLFPAI